MRMMMSSSSSSWKLPQFLAALLLQALLYQLPQNPSHLLRQWTTPGSAIPSPSLPTFSSTPTTSNLSPFYSPLSPPNPKN